MTSRESLFRQLNAKLLVLDSSLGTDVLCPICWKRFDSNSLASGHLSVDHVPSREVAKLLGERSLVTLTCRDCNNTAGTRVENDLKQLLVHQLHVYGKYNGPIPGTVTLRGTPPLHSNIILTSEQVLVSGVPKANNPATVKEHVHVLDEAVDRQNTNWGFSVSLNYGYKLATAWSGYLHTAYLAAFILTDCRYAFSKAGAELRRLLLGGNLNQLQPCLIQPRRIGVGGKLWMAQITEPEDLRCLWVKVAGNIAILPLPTDGRLSCYQAWHDRCEKTHFGLKPVKLRFRASFASRESALEAARCLPGVLAGLSEANADGLQKIDLG